MIRVSTDTAANQSVRDKRLSISDMNENKYPERIDRMFDAMLCLPRTAWGLLLREVEKKIGADALHEIIVRVFEETDRRKLEEFKRAVAVINREKREQQEKERKNKT